MKCSCYGMAKGKYHGKSQGDSPRVRRQQFWLSRCSSFEDFQRSPCLSPCLHPCAARGPCRKHLCRLPLRTRPRVCRNSSVSSSCAPRTPAAFNGKPNTVQVWKEVGDAIGSAAACALPSVPLPLAARARHTFTSTRVLSLHCFQLEAFLRVTHRGKNNT